MKLIGDNHIAKIDDKGRIVVPAVFKKRLQAFNMRQFMLKKEVNKQCLSLYPIAEWEKKEKFIEETLSEFNPEHELYISLFYKDLAELEMDNSGRLALPVRLKDKVKIGKEVLVKGVGKHLEFWDPETYDNDEITPEMYAKLGQSIFGRKE